MTKRLWLTAIFLLSAALACNTPGSSIGTPTTTAEVLVITATPAPPTQGLPPTATSVLPPTAAPSDGQPHFSANIRFSTEANLATGTRTFKTATKRIYGMWDYSGMAAGMSVRREWYLNGDLWLNREEAWDFTKYGASGTVTDISIYDLDAGLPTGQYELRLYIDNKPQFTGDADFDFRQFVVGIIGDGPGLGPQDGSILSPDGKSSALVENESSLIVIGSNGQKKTLSSGKTVVGFGWFPDSLHLVYSTRTDDGTGNPLGISFDLFVINVNTLGKTQLNNADEDLHDPVVSPTGKYLALLAGNDYGDACGISRVVEIMELDPVALTRVALVRVDTYTGIAKPADEGMPYADNGPNFTMPGVWQSPTTLKVAIRHTCTDGSYDAVYLADVVAKSLSPLESLPQP